MQGAREADTNDLDREQLTGGVIFGAAAIAFIGIAIPLIWRGAPLADDFNNCLAPAELGLGGFIRASWQQLGAIRPGGQDAATWCRPVHRRPRAADVHLALLR